MPAVLLIPLALILTAFVAYAMAFLQHSASHGVLGWITGVLTRTAFIGGLVADQVVKLSSWIDHYIGSHFKQVEQRAVAWIAGMSVYQKLAAAGAFGWPAELWALTSWLTSKAIPRGVKARTDPIDRKATAAQAEATQALRGVQDLAHAKPGTNTQVRVTRVERVAMPHAPEWEWINRHWKGLTAAVLGALAIPGTIAHPGAPSLTWPFGITPKRLFRRLRRVEKLLGVTGMAVAIAQVLRLPNARCLSNGAVGKVARALCGLGPRALEDLLGLLVDVLILENICTVITLMEDGFSLISGPVFDWLNTAAAQFVHCKYDLPGNDPMELPYLPPVTGVVLYPA